MSCTHLPHGSLEDLFFGRQPAEGATSGLLWRLLRPLGLESLAVSSSPGGPPAVELEQVLRIKQVTRVYWCSSPFEELGPHLSKLSPRTLPRKVSMRESRGLAGPATWEIGHSYALVDVEVGEDRPSQLRYRLNWGQGKRHGTNLSMLPHSDPLPEHRVRGERLEMAWQGTCSGSELYQLLKEWDGRVYDAAPSNNRNCHHFMQDLIHQCTAERGFDETRDRRQTTEERRKTVE